MRTLYVSVRCRSLPGSSACYLWLSVGMSDGFVSAGHILTNSCVLPAAFAWSAMSCAPTRVLGSTLSHLLASTSKSRDFAVFRRVLMGPIASTVVSVPFRTCARPCIHSAVRRIYVVFHISSTQLRACTIIATHSCRLAGTWPFTHPHRRSTHPLNSHNFRPSPFVMQRFQYTCMVFHYHLESLGNQGVWSSCYCRWTHCRNQLLFSFDCNNNGKYVLILDLLMGRVSVMPVAIDLLAAVMVRGSIYLIIVPRDNIYTIDRVSGHCPCHYRSSIPLSCTI